MIEFGGLKSCLLTCCNEVAILLGLKNDDYFDQHN